MAESKRNWSAHADRARMEAESRIRRAEGVNDERLADHEMRAAQIYATLAISYELAELTRATYSGGGV